MVARLRLASRRKCVGKCRLELIMGAIRSLLLAAIFIRLLWSEAASKDYYSQDIAQSPNNNAMSRILRVNQLSGGSSSLLSKKGEDPLSSEQEDGASTLSPPPSDENSADERQKILEEIRDPPDKRVDRTTIKAAELAAKNRAKSRLEDKYFMITQEDLLRSYYLTSDRGVLKIQKRRGLGNFEFAKKGDSVVVALEARFEDGDPYFSARGRYTDFQSLTIPLGIRSILSCEGLEIGLLTMEEGEVSIFTIEPEYGYYSPNYGHHHENNSQVITKEEEHDNQKNGNSDEKGTNDVTSSSRGKRRFVIAVELMKILRKESIAPGLTKQILQEHNITQIYTPQGQDECIISYVGRINRKVVCSGRRLKYACAEGLLGNKDKRSGGSTSATTSSITGAVDAIKLALPTMLTQEVARVSSHSKYVKVNNPQMLGSPQITNFEKLYSDMTSNDLLNSKQPEFVIEYDITLHKIQRRGELSDGVQYRIVEQGHITPNPDIEATVTIEIECKVLPSRTLETNLSLSSPQQDIINNEEQEEEKVIWKRHKITFQLSNASDVVPQMLEYGIEPMMIDQEIQVWGKAKNFNTSDCKTPWFSQQRLYQMILGNKTNEYPFPVAGNDTILFNVKLLSFKNPPKLNSTIDFISDAFYQKEMGNRFFNLENYFLARRRYGAALDSISSLYPIKNKLIDGYGMVKEEIAEMLFGTIYDDNKQPISMAMQVEVRKCRMETYSNMGALCLKEDKFREAEKWLLNALLFDGKNAKANYRMGIACLHQGKSEEALKWFREAYKLDPSFQHLNSLIAKTKMKYEREERESELAFRTGLWKSASLTDTKIMNKALEERETVAFTKCLPSPPDKQDHLDRGTDFLLERVANLIEKSTGEDQLQEAISKDSTKKKKVYQQAFKHHRQYTKNMDQLLQETKSSQFQRNTYGSYERINRNSEKDDDYGKNMILSQSSSRSPFSREKEASNDNRAETQAFEDAWNSLISDQ